MYIKLKNDKRRQKTKIVVLKKNYWKLKIIFSFFLFKKTISVFCRLFQFYTIYVTRMCNTCKYMWHVLKRNTKQKGVKKWYKKTPRSRKDKIRCFQTKWMKIKNCKQGFIFTASRNIVVVSIIFSICILYFVFIRTCSQWAQLVSCVIYKIEKAIRKRQKTTKDGNRFFEKKK